MVAAEVEMLAGMDILAGQDRPAAGCGMPAADEGRPAAGQGTLGVG